MSIFSYLLLSSISTVYYAIKLCALQAPASLSPCLLKETDKIQSYNNLIAKARRIVKSLRGSSVATEKLIQKCGKTVVTDCTTRWNSVYLMISRLLEINAF